MFNKPRRPDATDKYYVTYTITPHLEGLSREEVEAMDVEEGEARGASHDLLIFSMMHTSTGGLSTMISSLSHTGEELSDDELFKAWTLFTEYTRQKLSAANEPKIEGTRLGLLNTLWEIICAPMKGRG